MATQQQSPIPSYNLYGEMGDLPDVVHCEAIATRSILHDWVIKPHRHSHLHQFFFVQSGGGQFNIDGRSGTLRTPLILNIPPQVVHGFTFDIGTQGWVVTVPLEVLDQTVASILRTHLLLAKETEVDPQFGALFDAVASEHGDRRFARAHILQALVMLMAGHVVRAFVEKGQDKGPKTGPPLARQFEVLLEQHYRDHWTLNEYAKTLAVTSTHLTRVVKQHTGMPASKIIEGRLIQEARRNLAYTSLTISQIAYRIGYSDPAYFTRVFTRATGMAPSAFRTKLENSH